MEPFVALGAVVVRLLVKALAGDIQGSDSITLLEAAIPVAVKGFQRRAVLRDFESVSDNLAERVEAYVEKEFPRVPANEREAAVLLVAETLEEALLSEEMLLSMNLDVSKIEAQIRRQASGNTRKAGLSEQGEAVYDSALHETLRCLVSLTVRLPTFQEAESAELLSRTGALVELATKIFDQLPQEIATRGRLDTFGKFEEDYRLAIINYADKLKIFGVSEAAVRTHYSLTVAYISLRLESQGASTSPGASVRPGDRDTSTRTRARRAHENANSGGVEGVLEKASRFVVTGGAGNGKTTLLQWLAINAAKRTFSEGLDTWNNKIPFIIPLRHYVKANLPAPQDFLGAATPLIEGEMPEQWMSTVLREGRGLILIDGLDEYPIEDRHKVQNWIDDLVETFPESIFIVTTRGTALSAGWGTFPGFVTVSLQPMEVRDIEVFIHRWHDAAAKTAISDESTSIEVSRQAVLRAVRTNRSIRSLCTTPLLCALICALSKGSDSLIPENRIELYQTALSMLIKNRDLARGIKVRSEIDLNQDESRILLKSFAAWMHDNGQSEATRVAYDDLIARRVKFLHRITGTAPDVAQHLLVRSGVLREPSSGYVDFVHRSFLEFLAALEAVAEDLMPKLIDHAHDDRWREVIIVAAGLGRPGQRDKLLNGIIDRGYKEPRNKHRLHILAVACMETSPELSPALQLRLQECLAGVLPPRNMTDALGISSAGVLAAPMLRKRPKQKVLASAASVRALALIGGEESLEALQTFGRETRIVVARQLIRAWPHFDTEVFARTVLANTALDAGQIAVKDIQQYKALKFLNNLRGASVELSGQVADLAELEAVGPISRLFAGGSQSQSTRELPWGSLGDAAVIDLSHSPLLTSIEGFEQASHLVSLSFQSCVELKDVRELVSLKSLDHLNISNTAVADLGQLSGMSIDHVNATGGQVESITTPVKIYHLDLDLGRDFSARSALAASDITALSIHNSGTSQPVMDLPESLQEFDVWADGLRPSQIRGGLGISSILLWDATHLGEWIMFIRQRPVLREVSIGYNFDVGQIDIVRRIATLEHIQKIEISTPGSLEDVNIPGFEFQSSRLGSNLFVRLSD